VNVPSNLCAAKLPTTGIYYIQALCLYFICPFSVSFSPSLSTFSFSFSSFFSFSNLQQIPLLPRVDQLDQLQLAPLIQFPPLLFPQLLPLPRPQRLLLLLCVGLVIPPLLADFGLYRLFLCMLSPPSFLPTRSSHHLIVAISFNRCIVSFNCCTISFDCCNTI
jgi:hypothetical protein